MAFIFFPLSTQPIMIFHLKSINGHVMLILSKLLSQLKICMLRLICVYFFLVKTAKPQMLKERYEFVKNTTSTQVQPIVALDSFSLVTFTLHERKGPQAGKELGENDLHQIARVDLSLGEEDREWGKERLEMKKKEELALRFR